MRLALGSLASGSSGNCYLIKTENTGILVDAGISGKQIFERLKGYGMETLPDAVLITHEHSDHIGGIPALVKKKAKIYASKGTGDALPEKVKCSDMPELSTFRVGASFRIGDIDVESFALSHDAADPCGYSFSSGGACISIITDTGFVTPDCYRYMRRADILVLESNHDESMLRIGRYPWFLKQRILSDKGHLSNDAAAQALVDVLKTDSLSGNVKFRRVLLAHLSRENNFPQMAIATATNILEAEGFTVGRDLELETLSRTEPSGLFIL